MTSVPSPPERLLALDADFTRPHDIPQSATLLDGPRPAGPLVQHISRTQAMARGAQDVRDAAQAVPHLHHALARVGLDRTVQLATLATLAADHLLYLPSNHFSALSGPGPQHHRRPRRHRRPPTRPEGAAAARPGPWLRPPPLTQPTSRTHFR
ncbi:hypothetical protein [Streptomyces ziwulingensis]